MNKLLASAALAASLSVVSAANAQQYVTIAEAFYGGFVVISSYGNFCDMAWNDPGGNSIYATALAAKANHWPIDMADFQQVGQPAGIGPYGGNTCNYIESE